MIRNRAPGDANYVDTYGDNSANEYEVIVVATALAV